ncbi:MAG: hypothetical protein QOC66_1977, partial [Pseudonocardiales bacterium]|nr:hypothetical protein [Pseudonocardiales bacterium]
TRLGMLRTDCLYVNPLVAEVAAGHHR